MNLYAIIAEVLLFVALIGGAAFAVKGYNSAQRNEAVLSDRATAAEAVAEAEQTERKRLEGLKNDADERAERRRKEKQNADLALQQLADKYRQLAGRDPVVAEWRNTPVPPAVRRLRQPDAAAGGGNPASGVRVQGGTAPAASAEGGRRNER